MRRFEFAEGSSQKFWEIELRGPEFDVRWGRIGTSGQAQTKTFASDAKAQAEHDKLIKEKTGKGYVEVGASASSAPRVSAPTPAPTPIAAPSPAPIASPPITAEMPTPAANVAFSDLSTWPASLREHVLPRPAWSKAPKVDAKATWKRLRDRSHAASATDKTIPLQQRALEHLAQVSPAQGTFEVEVGLGLLSTSLPHDVIDHWFVHGGAEHALRCFVEAFGTKRWEERGGEQLLAATRLSEHFASLPPEERQKLALIAGAARFAHYVFPETGEADRAVQAGTNDVRSLAGIADESSLLAIGRLSYTYGLRVGPTWNERTLLPLLTTWLAVFGLALVPALESLLKTVETEADSQALRDIVQVLAFIGSPRAFEVLSEHADERAFVGMLREAAMRLPHVALPILALRATQRGAVAMPCKAILTQVLESAGDSLEALVEALPSAPKKLVMELRAKANVAVEEASEAELPSWLVTPPWEVKLTKATATALSLKVLPYEPTIVWPKGLRENWAARIRRRTGPINYLKQWGISEDLAKRLAERDEPSDEAEAKQVIAALPSSFSPWEENLVGLPPRLTRKLMRLHAHRQWFGTDLFCKELATDGLDALDVVLPFAKHHPNIGLAILLPVGLPELAAEAAVQLLKAKRDPAHSAIDWLKLHPEAAAMGLIPNAVGKPGKARDGAEKALRFLAQEGHASVVLAVAARYGEAALQVVKEAMDANPAAQTPTKIPPLPDLVRPASLPRLVLAATGKALPASAMNVVLKTLQLSTLEAPYACLPLLKELTTSASRGALAWELFQAWLVAGAPSKEGWCFTALGHFGDDACARNITPLIRVWPGEAQHQRAVTGLDVLAMIGTDVALMNLHGIAQKLKFKGLQEKARGKIDDIARARGFTADELADRLVPDLGLDEDGSLTLDFGPRQFRVSFDESLKPLLKEGEKVLTDLPKPKKEDDAERSKEATETWKALKKDAKVIAQQQVLRLETAMCSRRFWSEEVFRRFLAEHALVKHLVVRLAWGAYDNAGKLVCVFRLAEDGTFANADDETITLPEGAQIGVVHSLEVNSVDQAKLGQTFADYKLLQPFKQLGRETYVLSEAELEKGIISRWSGKKVATGKVLGLESRGWQRGDVEDHGHITWIAKQIHIGTDVTVITV